MSKLNDIDEADVSFSSLDSSDIVAMQIRQLGQFLL